MGKIDNIRLRETLFLIVWSVSVYHAFLTGWSSQQCSTATRNDTTRHPVYSPTLFITGLPGIPIRMLPKVVELFYSGKYRTISNLKLTRQRPEASDENTTATSIYHPGSAQWGGNGAPLQL